MCWPAVGRLPERMPVRPISPGSDRARRVALALTQIVRRLRLATPPAACPRVFARDRQREQCLRAHPLRKWLLTWLHKAIARIQRRESILTPYLLPFEEHRRYMAHRDAAEVFNLRDDPDSAPQ